MLQIKEGQVVLYLMKVKSRSWARELSEGGLETYDEDAEAEQNVGKYKLIQSI